MVLKCRVRWAFIYCSTPFAEVSLLARAILCLACNSLDPSYNAVASMDPPRAVSPVPTVLSSMDVRIHGRLGTIEVCEDQYLCLICSVHINSLPHTIPCADESRACAVHSLRAVVQTHHTSAVSSISVRLKHRTM